MIYFIYPIDKTTEFLLQIPNRILEKSGRESGNIITIFPNDDSYNSCLDEIANLPDSSIVIFMGHGQDNILWGAESEIYKKKPLIVRNQVKIFSNKHLFCLSCNSNEFLRSTFNFSKIISSIGFGSLPTEITEVNNNRRLKELGINIEVIFNYKEILVELVTESFCDMLDKGLTFNDLSNNFSLRLNKKISEVILKDKKSVDMKILSDLLFQMKTEMIFI